MSKRIIIVGKGGSGKDHLRKTLSDTGYKYCVSHTTRPARQDEKNEIDYFFISNNDPLINEFLDNNFYESVTFNGWFYGTSISEFRKSNLLIMTPSGIKKLKPEDRKESYIIYLNISYNVRKERLLLRRDADDVERRLAADYYDFLNFKDFDMELTDPFFSLKDLDFLKIEAKN